MAQTRVDVLVSVCRRRQGGLHNLHLLVRQVLTEPEPPEGCEGGTRNRELLRGRHKLGPPEVRRHTFLQRRGRGRSLCLRRPLFGRHWHMLRLNTELAAVLFTFLLIGPKEYLLLLLSELTAPELERLVGCLPPPRGRTGRVWALPLDGLDYISVLLVRRKLHFELGDDISEDFRRDDELHDCERLVQSCYVPDCVDASFPRLPSQHRALPEAFPHGIVLDLHLTSGALYAGECGPTF